MLKRPYEESFDLPCYMFDRNEHLRPGALMDIFQQQGAKGTTQFAMTDFDLAKHNLVWIIVRMHFKLESFPRREDPAVARTWHRGLAGPTFIRDYTLETPSGERIAGASSTWVIMDKRTRTIVRGQDIADIVPTEPQWPDFALDCVAPKIIVPKSAEKNFLRRVRANYSYVDYNGHVNNARYVDWAMDALPDDLVYGKKLRELSINYNNEVRPGADVELYYLIDGDGSYVVEGLSTDKPSVQHFICRLTFGD